MAASPPRRSYSVAAAAVSAAWASVSAPSAGSSPCCSQAASATVSPNAIPSTRCVMRPPSTSVPVLDPSGCLVWIDGTKATPRPLRESVPEMRELAIERLRAVDRAPDVELADALTRGPGEPPGERAVVEEPVDGRGERRAVAHRGE